VIGTSISNSAGDSRDLVFKNVCVVLVWDWIMSGSRSA